MDSPQMKDVMLDFETLGTGPHKAICQVGAVFFNNSTGELGERLKINIDAHSHQKLGGVLDAPTVYWWLSQLKEAQNSILEEPRLDIVTAMTQLNEFFRPAKRVWSHATFDFVTYMTTLQQLDIKPSVSFKAGMDLRTLVWLAGTNVSSQAREGVHHDALDDCLFQVKYCVEALNVVRTNAKAIGFLERLTMHD